MNPDIVLLILRIVGAFLLLSFFATLGYFIYRDFQVTARYAALLRTPPGSLIVIESEKGPIEDGERHKLIPLTTIGRDESNTITIMDDYASIEHATVAFRDHQWWIVDLNSRNGTLLNGAPVTSATIVKDGDIIVVGQTHFRALL